MLPGLVKQFSSTTIEISQEIVEKKDKSETSKASLFFMIFHDSLCLGYIIRE